MLTCAENCICNDCKQFKMSENVIKGGEEWVEALKEVEVLVEVS